MKTLIGPRSVAVLGYGSQGRAQSIRLKRAGLPVRVGLRTRSRTRRMALRDGMTVTTPARAIRGADTVVMLVPDQYANPLLAELATDLEPGALIVFAAGFPVAFPLRPLPSECDIVLVAPHGPGSDLVAGRRMSGFVGVSQDYTGKAARRATAYARKIGLKPVYESSPEDEAMGDLFGEQTLLCGGLLSLTAAVAQIMIERGLSRQNAYFETVAQLDRLSLLLKEQGVRRFWEEISDCAAAGASAAADAIVDGHLRRTLNRLYDRVESGAFAKSFYRSGRPGRLPKSWRVLEEMEQSVKK